MNNYQRIFHVFLLLSGFQPSKSVLNAHDENFFNHTADRYDWSKHPCIRECNQDEKPKTCYYVFVVEHYYAMSSACYDCPLNMTDCFRPHCIPTDGFEKPVYVVNRQLPGPIIEVCEQDNIEVDVRNRMLSESTTIHWHGFKQRGTPYMDGVPYVSQCPILPGENFRYVFKARDPGTFFYHSHIGNQRGDGLFGTVVVKKFKQHELMDKLYDHDDIRMIIGDWSHMTGDETFAKFYYKKFISPDNILINGFGPSKKFQASDGRIVQTPSAIFEVVPGSRHRVRLINAGYDDCPIAMSIDNHTMLIIGMDSNDIEPIEVDVLTIWAGERIDFVIKANQPSDNYWIRFNGYSICNYNETDGVYQTAVLKYSGVSLGSPQASVTYSLPSVDNQRILNPYNIGSELKSSKNVDIVDLKALTDNDVTLQKHAHQQVYLGFNFYGIDNYDFNRKDLYGYGHVEGFGTLQFNHLSLKLPPVPLMSQWDMLKSNSFCNASHHPSDTDCYDKHQQCACTHVIQLKKNSVVELIFVAEGLAEFPISLHPLHLHGHFFRVIAMNKLEGNVTVDRIKQLDSEGKIHRRLDHSPLKDTIKTPKGGYTIVRFFTGNPGYWFFHCHFEPHDNIGMALIFKSGEHEDFPKKPKGFPSCRNYNA